MTLRRTILIALCLMGGMWLISLSRAEAQSQGQGSQLRGSLPEPPRPPQASLRNLGAGQYSTEAEARSACPGGSVVWVNTATKVAHPRGDRYYGKTKHGAYMCESEALRHGIHMAHIGKLPPPGTTPSHTTVH